MQDIRSKIDKLQLSYHTTSKYKQMIDKLSRNGVIFKGNQIENTGEQLQSIINNLKKNGTNEKISKNYTMDFYATLKALQKYNIFDLTQTQLKIIEDKFAEHKKIRDTPDTSKYEQSELTLKNIRQKLLEYPTLTPQKMILMLLTFLPPRRLDYRNIRVIFKTPPTNQLNYLAVHKKFMRLYFRDYKGCSSKGEQMFQLNNELSPLLPSDINYKQFMSVFREYVNRNQKYLFEIDKAIPYTQSQFSQFVSDASQTILGEALCVNHYRHLFISTYKSQSNITKQQFQFISEFMCHSPEMQQQYVVSDMVQKSMVQDTQNFNKDQCEERGLYNVYRDKNTGNFYLVK